MPAREKTPGLPPQSSFAPLGQAVMESFGEGVVVFDPYGRMLYANQRARRTLDAVGDGAAHRGENLRDRLVAFGGRVRSLKQGSVDLGEAFDNGGFADAGFAEQDGIVLRATAENLDDAFDFVFAADDRIHLAFAGDLRQVASEGLQRRGLDL